MADYGAEYHVGDADYEQGNSMDGQTGFFIALGGFALVGLSFLAAAFGLTAGQLAILNLLESGELSSLQAQAYLEGYSAIMAVDGELTVEGLLLLDGFDASMSWEDYQNLQDFLDNGQPGDCYTDSEGNPLLCVF